MPYTMQNLHDRYEDGSEENDAKSRRSPSDFKGRAAE